jgi:hypothetical protein
MIHSPMGFRTVPGERPVPDRARSHRSVTAGAAGGKLDMRAMNLADLAAECSGIRLGAYDRQIIVCWPGGNRQPSRINRQVSAPCCQSHVASTREPVGRLLIPLSTALTVFRSRTKSPSLERDNMITSYSEMVSLALIDEKTRSDPDPGGGLSMGTGPYHNPVKPPRATSHRSSPLAMLLMLSSAENSVWHVAECVKYFTVAPAFGWLIVALGALK